MKHLSALVLAALGGYVQLALGADASFYACYSNQGSLVKKESNDFQSRGACRKTCVDVAEADGGPGYSVQAMTNGTVCLCSQTLPNDIYKAANSSCQQDCPGFSSESCGSRLGTFFSVYLTGLDDGLPDKDPAPTSSSSSATSTSTESTSSTSTSSAAISSTAAPVTTPSPTATSEPKKSVNTAGVAAGVVVGVLVIAGIGIGIFLLMKKRRREKVEEEYRKSAAAREFARKPEQDHRLDPVMIQRRDSVGSIADNQDYSRRILKVTNPDGN